MKLPLFFLFACVSSGWAAPLINEPVAELHLVSGKVLRQAQAKGYLRNSVLVKHSEGAETVVYEEFPLEYREQLFQKRPALEPTAGPQRPSQAPPLPVTKRAEQTAASIDSTLSLVTSRVRATYTAVELHNHADTPVEVRCSVIQAKTNLGTFLIGRQWVEAAVPDMISGSLGSKQVIAEHTSATFNIAFDPLPPGVSITQVFLSEPAK